MKTLKLQAILACLLAAVLLTAGCGQETKAAAMKEESDYIFGTLVSLKLYEPVEDAVFQEVFGDLRDVENRLTVKGIASELIGVNAAAGKEAVAVSEDTYHVIDVARRYAEESQGAFDVTVFPVVSLWNIGTDQARVPSEEEIKGALKNVGYQDIVLDPAARTVFLKRPGMGLDLGGIAKGYAADRTTEKLKAMGITRGIVNLGGNIFALGTKADGTPWKIGIQNPMSDRGEYIGIVAAADQTVVTSGIYERYFEKDGKHYHHIIDPATGYPAENELAGVSILTASSIDADALSTTCFVMGTEKALEFVKGKPGTEVLFITKDKRVIMTEGFKKVFKLTDESFRVVEQL